MSIFAARQHSTTEGIIAGALVITLVGALDDIFDLPAGTKLAGQFVAVLIPVLSGVVVEERHAAVDRPLRAGRAGAEPLTMIGIVAVINVVNLTDGVDGLAAGVCAIAAATFAMIALSLDRDAAGILAACTAGASAGFLVHNFHPASIFMGDAGSNLLGYLLACIAIQGVLKTAAAVALFFPLVVLAVPILDTGFVVAKRLKYGEPIYRADSWHFHHRFANIGFSQRRTVLYLYGWTLCLAGLALALRFIPYSDGHGNLDTGWTLVLAADRRAGAGRQLLPGGRARDPQAAPLQRPSPAPRTATTSPPTRSTPTSPSSCSTGEFPAVGRD